MSSRKNWMSCSVWTSAELNLRENSRPHVKDLKSCANSCADFGNMLRENWKRIVDSLRELNFLQVEFEIAFKQLHDFSKTETITLSF